jgi:predicted RNA-binding protein with PIN domain
MPLCPEHDKIGAKRQELMVPASKVLVVDGYNVINRLPEFKPASARGLEAARLQLALRVSAWGHLHPEFECLIVFDGDRQGTGGGGRSPAGVRCVFSSRPHEGDEEIIRQVRALRSGKRAITVVSDDNHVANNCRVHGAVIEPARFLAASKAPVSRGPARSRAAGKGIDARTAARIDKEMEAVFGSEDGKRRPR